MLIDFPNITQISMFSKVGHEVDLDVIYIISHTYTCIFNKT